jgi:hypothetical protein
MSHASGSGPKAQTTSPSRDIAAHYPDRQWSLPLRPKIIYELIKEAVVIRVERKLNSVDVVDALTDVFILRGPREYARSDNGAEFIPKKLSAWIGGVARVALSSLLAHRGKTDTARASSPDSEMSSSTAKRSTRSARPKASSKNGGVTTK